MIEIKHKETGHVLLTVDAETLQGARLSGKNLSNADLSNTDLSDADLSIANLAYANLSGAKLTYTNLAGANLILANLNDANLTGAQMNSANLIAASLTATNLTGAKLSHAILNSTYLASITLTDAALGGTSFGNCPDLHGAKGLGQIDHLGPSYLDTITLRACVNDLPNEFLLGVGYTHEEIKTLRRMYPRGFKYFSCFLSHAAKDGEFVDRLRESLLAKDVLCYHYQYDTPGGQPLEFEIDKAIKSHDKLVLVCSKSSLLRENVVKEIIAAIEQEQRFGEKKLFPIRLDDYLFDDELSRHAERMVKHGVWKMNWVDWTREVFAPDFRNWKDHAVYQKALENLLRDLKSPTTP